MPAPNTDFVAVAVGFAHSLGIMGQPRACGGDTDLADLDVPLADLGCAP